MSLKSGSKAREAAVRVPASAANLGGGFDTLAVAVQLYLRVRVLDVREDGAAALSIVKSAPPVAGANAVERAYAAAARWTGLRAPSVVAETESDIPLAAGLGSSAAATVAGLRVFEQVTEPLPEGVLLGIAASLEGHADNAAAAIHGGLTSVLEREGDEPLALRWQWPAELRLVVASPEGGLATTEARAALPDAVARADAVHNLQRVLLLVHALQTGDYRYLREAVADRWHQSARAALVPQLDAALALEDPEVLGAFLSGAGPSVALLARRDFARLERLLASVYERDGCPVAVRTLSVHPSSEAAREALASAQGRPV